MQLTLARPVAAALRTGLPVVALESTAITHGLPSPGNVQTALAMEAAISAVGRSRPPSPSSAVASSSASIKSRSSRWGTTRRRVCASAAVVIFPSH